MTIDKQKLKALALAAPKGPWFGPEYDKGTSYVFDCDLGSLLHYESIESEQDDCLRYVAAANPATVLALLAEIEQLQEHKQHLVDLREKHGFDSWSAALVEIDQLKADNEALRKDAERYRWTDIDGNWLARMFGKWRAHTGEYGEANPTAWYPSRGEAIDAAISHAQGMAKEAK